MARQVLNLFLQPVPADHAPAVWIRHIDIAFLSGFLVAMATYVILGWLLWRPILGHDVPDGGLGQLASYPGVLLSLLSGGRLSPHALVDNPAAGEMGAVHWRLFPSLVVALLLGGLVLRSGLTPWRRMKHIDGPQLLDGKEAENAARRISASEVGSHEPFMSVHPLLPAAKSRWTRGVLLYGSPGSGKTVALIPIIEQLIAADHRSFIYDVKGDFTSYWLGGSVALVCPWDRRSLIWDLGSDVCTPSQAQTFSHALIEDAQGDGKFWSSAARQLLEGTLISLQNELGTNWGWHSLAERLTVDAPAFAERMTKHAPLAALLVLDPKSSTTSSVLATLAGYTKPVHDLARAWKDGEDDQTGEMRPSISFTAWAKDSYAGKHRQIIFQAGPDRAATTALGSAILNVLTPELVTSALPDDEMGRTICFVIDEMPSLGPIPFQALIERGRSKGVIFIGACQTLDQIEEVWGKETMRSLGSMIGTQICFRVQPSPGRDSLSEQFGKARWSVTAVSTSASGTSTSVHEENRAVVQPHELSELGPVRGKRFPLGWGVSAIVAGIGNDLLRLEFPGVSPSKRRSAHRPAAWTMGPARPGMTPEPTAVERWAQAKARELAWETAKMTEDAIRAKARPAPRGESRPAKNKGVSAAAAPGFAAKILADGATSPLAELAAAATPTTGEAADR